MFRPFGGSATTFGSIPPSPQQPSGTGTSSFFGGGPTIPAFGSPNVPFQPHKDLENGLTVTIHSISAMPNYIGKSFEEIRLEDYAMGRKGRTNAFPSATSTSSSFIGSGQPSSAPFGTTQPSTGPFGPSGMTYGNQSMGSTNMMGTGTSLGTSLFGQSQQQQPTSMFGTPQTTSSGFGTSGGFGQSTNSIFGPSSVNSFGQQQPSTAPPSISNFGGFGINSNMGSGFGQSNHPSAPPSTSIFEQPQGQQQQPPSAFGTSFPSTTPSTNTSSGFGTGLFPTQQQASSQTALGGFGIGQTSNQSSLFPGFGAPKPTTQTSSLFNPPATLSGGSSLFPSTTSTAAPTTAPSSGFELFKPSQPSIGTTQNSTGFGLGIGSSNIFQPKPSLFPTSTAPASTGTSFFQPTSSFNTSSSSLQQPSSLFKPAVTSPSISALPVIAPPPEILSIAPPLHPSLKNISSAIKPSEPKPKTAFNPLPSSSQTPIAITTQLSTTEMINIVPKIIGNLVPLGNKKISSKSDVKKLIITVSLQSNEAEDDARTNAPARIGDYYMEPSESALRKISPSQLAAVPNFVIGQTGVGEIRFLKPVDLTSVDLDRIFSNIVRFEPKQVVMYPEEDKPAVGQGLNQPALIKLERCWPTQRGSRMLITDPENERMRQHIDRLKNVPDTKFVAFDPTTGIWQFEVENF